MGPQLAPTSHGRARAALAVLTAALALSACQTTADGQAPGAAIGGVGGASYGATYGAISGNGGGPLAAGLVGAIVGAIAGHMIIGDGTGASFTSADSDLANATAQQVAGDPTLAILRWESTASSRVYGWSEPVEDDTFGARKDCRVIRSVRFVAGIATDEKRRYCPEGGSWVAGEKLTGT